MFTYSLKFDCRLRITGPFQLQPLPVNFTTAMTKPKRIQVTFDLATQSQAAELNAAWQEILAGQRSRINTRPKA